MSLTTAKPGRNQFKCFHCRHIFANKDGDWFDWDNMQVHLCWACDKLTQEKPQRNHSKS